MVLHRGQAVLLARGPGLDVPPAEVGGRPQGVGIDAHIVTDVPGSRAAIAQGQADHAIGHAGQEEDWGQDLCALGGKLDQFVLLRADVPSRLLADHGGVVPGKPRHRVGQLLQPAVVGETAVVQLVGVEDEFAVAFGQAARRAGLRRKFHASSTALVQFLSIKRLPRREIDATFGQKLLPAVLREIGVAHERLDRFPHDVVAAPRLAFAEHGKDLDRTAAVEQRLDQRLHDAHGGVERTGVAPRFKVVRPREVPVAMLRGLVLVQAQVGRVGDLFQRLSELQVRRCVVHRISAQDQQRLDLSGLHSLDQFLDVGRMAVRPRIRIVSDGLVNVAQLAVDSGH